MAHDTIYTPY